MLEQILTNLVTQWPLALLTFFLLVIYLHLIFAKIIRNEVRYETSKLRQDIYIYNRTLFDLLYTKGMFTDTEIVAMKELLEYLRPSSSTKYYTKEVEKKLNELLKKNLDEYTWDDIFELYKIAELIEKEWEISNRKELLDYASRLRLFTTILEIRLVKKGVLPLKR